MHKPVLKSPIFNLPLNTKNSSSYILALYGDDLEDGLEIPRN